MHTYLYWLFALIGFFPGQILAYVEVDATQTLQESPRENRAGLREMIASGQLDDLEIRYRGQTLNAVRFLALPPIEQALAIDFLAAARTLTINRSFVAKVNTENNDLASEPALERLEIDLGALPKVVGAESLLSSYARKWAYKMSDYSGPNCWHTSMAAIFKGWNKHRYMNAGEFSCHVRTSFEEIPKPEKWGDLISITSGNRETHGFTFLGPSRQNPTELIVFTKNGYAQSRYLFMTLTDVVNIYRSSNTKIKYYRPIGEAMDPSEHTNAPCYNDEIESLQQNTERLVPDGNLLHGLRILGATTK